MKPTRSNPLFARFFGASFTSLIVLSGSASAAEISYQTTGASTAEVTTAGNWFGGVAPGIADIAAWKTDGDAGTAGNQEARGGTLTIASPVSWLGFRHEDSSGALTLTGSPITLGASGITEVRYELLTISNNIVLGANQTWNNGQTVTLNGNVTGAFSLTKDTGGSDLIFTGSTLGGGLVHIKAGRLVINPATVGGTVTMQSLRTQKDIRVGNNALLDVTSGSVGLSTAGGFWIQPSGTGTSGRLTSSSGALSIASVDTNGVVTTGAFTTVDQQIKTPIVDFNGSTPLSVTKSGVNSLVLDTANTYTGVTTVNGGRLQLSNAAGLGTGAVTVASGAQVFLNGVGTYPNNFTIAGTGPTEGTTNYGAIRFNNNTISGSVTLAAGGARIGGTGGTGTISGALVGSGPLEINSAATGATCAVTLSGNASGYTGAATVSQGSLTIVSGFGGSVSKATGTTLINNGTINSNLTHTTGTLQGIGTIAGNVTLNGTTAADVLNVVPGAMNVTGNVTLSGTTTIRASGLGGTLPVLTYSGGLTGGAANLSLENAGTFRAGTHFDTGTPGVIKLVIPSAPVTWTNAAADMIWNTTALDWDNGGSPDIYHQGDLVTFGDTGSGTVTLAGVISPSSIAINNTAGHDYTFTGTAGNVIGGTTGITKSGGGALTLATSNTFLGAITLNGGTTTFPARQVYTGGTTINSGAVLDLTGGGGQGGTIRGTVNVNGSGILRVSTGDATGWGVGTDRINVLNLSNGGTFEINNNANNQTLSNMAIILTGGNITRGGVALNGNIDLFNGSTSVSTLASSTTSVIAAGVNVGLRQATTTITTALGSTPSGIDLQIDGSVNNASQPDFASPALVKSGPGTLCLNNSPAIGVGTTAVYTGTTTIDGGTLLVGTGGTTGIISSGLIIDNAALAFNRSDVVTLANGVSGTGILEQRGSGELNLTNGGARSGDTLVTAGRLNIGTTAFTASTFRANPGGTLGAGTTAAIGTGTVAGLALNGGTAAFRASTSLADKIVVSATNGFSVTAPSQISCTPSGILQTGDILQLIDYSGTIGGSGFAGLSLTSTGNPHYALTLVNNTIDTRVDATVIADTVIWKGNVDDAWDKATSNWTTASNGLTSLFYENDKVKFTDAGSAHTSIFLLEPMVPSNVEFNATIDYTLNGNGITGPTGLVKNNTGTATLTNENTYTGTTTINAGTLQIGDGGFSGSLGATAITNNASLVYNSGGPLTASQVISGSGQIIKRGDGQLTLSGANTFSGPIIVEAGTLAVGNAGALGTQANGVTVNPGATINLNGVTIPAGESISCGGTGIAGYAVTGEGTIRSNLVLTENATIGSATGRLNIGFDAEPVNISGAYTLTKAGANFVWYRCPDNGVGNSLAALVVNEGGFGIETGNNGLNGVPITVNSLGTLSAWAKPDALTPTSQNNPITLNGGGLGSDFAGETWTGPVTLTADSTLGGPASTQNFTIAGVISQSAGSFGLTKTQVSTVTLTAVSTYTGNTTVNTGAITLADNAGLRFVIGANGVNNKLTGAGTATLNGDFTLDLSGAAIANGNSWTLVDTATKSFGATFTLNGFTETADVHTKVAGSQTWTFTESTGVLSLAVSGNTYGSWAATNAAGQTASEDYDQDGVANGIEYFMGATGSSSTANPGVNAGKVIWPKSGTFTGSYAVQTSPDLVIWTTAVMGIVDNGTSVEYTLPTGAGKIFVHLLVAPN